MSSLKYNIERICSLIAAVLLMQTLFYKFSAATESVYIFNQLGLEPYGRIGIGIVELITAILLLFRKTFLYGSVLGLFIISGAIFSHVFVIGIEVLDDNGLLFILALIVFICCSIVLFIEKGQLFYLIKNKRNLIQKNHQ